MIRFALNTYGNFAVRYFARNLDNLLIGKFIGIQTLGYYKKAYDLFALPANQLTAPLSNVALAALSRYSNDHDNFRRYFLNAFSIISFVSMGLSLVLTISSKDIILLILGPKWMVSARIFMFFGPGVSMMLLYYTHGWLHLSLGRADRWLRWSFIELVVTATFIVVGIQYNATGVAIAWTLSFSLLLGPALWYAGRPVHLRLISIFSEFWRYMAAALAAGIVSAFLLFSNNATSEFFSGLPVFLRLVVSSSLCLLLYLIFTILFYQSIKPITQLISIIRTMRPDTTGSR
jgi:PST family polysaccharide transporter